MRKIIPYALYILLIAPSVNASNKENMIEELIGLLRIQHSIEYEINLYMQFIDRYMETVKKDKRSDLLEIDELKNNMKKTLSDEFNWDNYKKDYSRIVSEAYGEDELAELISFYKSEIGKKAIERELNIRNAFVNISFERRKIVLDNFRKLTNDTFSKSSTLISNPQKKAALYFHMGNDFYSKKEYIFAIKCYQKAIDLNPHDYNPYNNLAWILSTCPDLQLRNGVKAVELAKKAYHMNQEIYVIDTLAAAYAEIGDYKKAIALLQDAINRLKQNDVKDAEINYYSDHLKEIQEKAK